MPTATFSIPPLTEKNKRNFLRKASLTPNESGCLNWMASRNKKGYGQFAVGRKPFLSHRVAFLLHYETDPGGLQVLHRCDNPSCVNPDHLWLGTNEDNVRDRESKCRNNPQRGDKNGARIHPERMPRGNNHGMSKVTAAEVIIIRGDARTLTSIAADYGVTPSLISQIKRRKTWRHVA